MNKIIKGFVILFIAVSLVFLINNNSYASCASISAPGSVKEGETFTVTLNLPGEAYGASATVTCAGQTKVITYVKGMEGQSNSTTFKAPSAGKVTVSASAINIADKSGNKIEVGGSTSTSITVNGNQPAPTPTPVPTPVPTQESTPAPTPVPTQASTPAPTPVPTKEPEKQPNFKSVNDKIYAKKSMNVRESWTTSSKKVGSLSEGQEVTRIGIGDNGWSKISFNGKTAYVSTGLITTTKPEPTPTPEPSTEPSAEPSAEPSVEPTPEDSENTEDILANEDIAPKTDEEIYAELVEKIGTIPEVGKNVNIVYFIVCAVVSTGLVYFVIRKEA